MTLPKKEILPIALIVGMIILTIMSFISGGITIATNCLIITIVTTFVYLLITFLQNKTHLYNIPYNIPNDKRPQANTIIANFIIMTKNIIILLFVAVEVTLHIKSALFIHLSLAIFGLILIYAIFICHKKIKSLTK